VVGILSWRRTDEHQSTSVFAALSGKRLDRIHDATSLTQSDKRPCRSSLPSGRQKPYICASSAKRCGWKFLISIKRNRSAVYSRNSIGPRTDPCGTPNSTGRIFDLFRPQRTCCVRPSTYEVNHQMMAPPRPWIHEDDGEAWRGRRYRRKPIDPAASAWPDRQSQQHAGCRRVPLGPPSRLNVTDSNHATGSHNRRLTFIPYLFIPIIYSLFIHL
jgi:hypothetical protein